ncbi:hypothetical protein BDV33DRAFT_177300 [Aspergillus novoparasiticus]|uniref:Uncharacterized protein n=1 Tax=Aspergillus novoparasiticus TaxID=986946 RepID=A0A5N6EI74_9EURO|nr:hypothetical protein BDV33DRAFT_177300 [Aspergillus novoparasiticus]
MGNGLSSGPPSACPYLGGEPIGTIFRSLPTITLMLNINGLLRLCSGTRRHSSATGLGVIAITLLTVIVYIYNQQSLTGPFRLQNDPNPNARHGYRNLKDNSRHQEHNSTT